MWRANLSLFRIRPWQHRAKPVAAIGSRARSAPSKKSWIGSGRAWVQRMAKNSICIGLPDLDNRIERWLVALLHHRSRKQNVLALRDAAFVPGKVAGPV